MAVSLGELFVRMGIDVRDFQKGVAQVQATTAQMAKQFEGFEKTTSGLLVPTGTLGKNLEKVEAGAAKVGTGMKAMGGHMHGAAQKAEGFLGIITSIHSQLAMLTGGAALTAAFTLPFVALGKSALNASISFESAFAGVRKTVDASESEFARLEERFRSMSLTTPIAANEFARIGELAGQLGIRGVSNITQFTDTIAKLGVTTNLTTEEAATSLARFANIMEMPTANIGRLGSTIVDLGNKFATTERELTEFALRIAGAGRQIGLSESQVLAFGTALSSVGINAEAGGTAISRVFVKLANATASGGKELEQFAAVAGTSAEAFAKAFRDDAATATIAFIEGLRRVQDSGGNVFAVLEKLELQDIRVRDALLRTAGAGDLLRRALDVASDAWRQNTALATEAEKRFKTIESRIKLVRNTWDELARNLGALVIPSLLKLADATIALIKFLDNLSPTTKAVILALGAVAAAVGSLLMGMAMLGFAIVGIKAAAAALGVTAPVIALVLALLGALVTAGMSVYKNWDLVKLAALNTWGEIKATIYRAIANIMNAYATFIGWFNKAEGERLRVAAYNMRVNADLEARIIMERRIAYQDLVRHRANLDAIMAEREKNAAQVAAEAESVRQDAYESTGLAYRKMLAEIKRPTPTTPPGEATTTFERLEAQIAHLEAQYARYKAEIGETGTAEGRLQFASQILQAKLAVLAQRLPVLRAEYDSANASTGEFSKKTLTAQRNLDSATGTMAETAAALRDVQKALKTLQFPLSDATTQLAVLDAQLKHVESESDSYMTTAGKAAKTTEGLGQQFAFLLQKVQVNAEKVKLLTKMLDESKAKTNEASPETLALAAALDDATRTGIGFAAALREIASEYTKAPLKQAAEDTAKAIAQSDAQLAHLDSGWKIFTATATQSATSMEYLVQQQEYLQSKLALVNEQITLLQAQYDRTKAATGEFSAETLAARAALDNAKVAVSGLQGELRKVDVAMTEFTAPIMLAKQELEQAAGAVKKAQNAVGNFTAELDSAQSVLQKTDERINKLKDTSQKAEQGISDALGVMTNEVERLKQEIDNTESALQGLGNVRLKGQSAFEKQLFDLSMQEAKIRLQINRLKQTGVADDNADLKALEAQLGAIGLKREAIELQREIDVAPLQDELKRLTTETQELTFEEAKAKIAEYQTKLGELIPKHADLSARLDTVRASLTSVVPSIVGANISFAEAEKAIRSHKSTIEANNAALGGPNGLLALQNTQRTVVEQLTGKLEAARIELTLLTLKETATATALEDLRKAAVKAAEQMNRIQAPAVGGGGGGGGGGGPVIEVPTPATPIPIVPGPIFTEEGGRPFFGAKGGILQHPVIAGEAGPEGLIPLRRLGNLLAGFGGTMASVAMRTVAPMLPAGDMAFAGGGGGTVVIQVTGNTLLGDDSRMARELARILEPQIRRYQLGRLVVE